MPCINLLSLGDNIKTIIPTPTAINPNTVYTSIYRASDSAAEGIDAVASIISSALPALAPVSFANCPAKKLDPENERNHAPISVPDSRSGASLVTIDRPIGEINSSPTVWKK